ncbi:MAG TPA: RNA polymerase subunit sigma-70 [Pseudonocardiaceae bacterium]|nr:RNA polymerase subunit sigma-70 [Pseudonocardiaceae bacterium]
MDLDEDAVAAAQLLALACAGDNEAFGRLTAPHRRELLIHCYRMLGSLQDAEDALQETLLAAWQALAGFELRSSLRTWLYTIATHRCLNARRATRRRPPKEWDVPGVQPPMPSRLGEVVWLEPLPDELVASGVGLWPGPETVYEQGESISLAFITALQVLPPRQLAVLVLRDVLGFRASEVANMLATTTESVTSALKRARATMKHHQAADVGHQASPPAGSPTENALVAQFVRAYESSDVDALIALLTDDVFMSMPPMPFEYEGKDLVAEFWHLLFRADRKYRLIPTRANGQPAFGSYVRAADGLFHCTGLFVLTLAGNQICALTRFETTTVPRFGLPRSLPSS